MAEILKVTNEERCIGCGLCVLASSKKVRGKFSIADSPIRVLSTGVSERPFSIRIDEAHKMDLASLVRVCPRDCFGVSEE